METRSYLSWKQRLIPIACIVLHNFLYLVNQDIDCWHMYLHPKEDDGGEDLHEDDDDNDAHDNGVEEEGPLEPVPHDRRAIATFRARMARMTNAMYAAYRRQPWYKQ